MPSHLLLAILPYWHPLARGYAGLPKFPKFTRGVPLTQLSESELWPSLEDP